jgi:formamidopyrimidine-DNA glycosylase
MPELPEVETVRLGLAPAMVGARLLKIEQRRPDLRFPFPERFAERLTGATVTSLARRAKYLLAELTSGEVLVMHLGMSGRFVVANGGRVRTPGAFHSEHGRDGTHDHVVFRLSNGTSITYNDARRFGFMDLVPGAGIATCRYFRGLGIEPLGEDLSGAAIARLFAGRRTPLKAALLDQRLIAGLGNIYACEALHRAGLHPRTPAGRLASRTGGASARADRLAGAIREVLTEAVAAGGSTLRDHARVDGSLGRFQHRFRVYGRAGEACASAGCSGRVRRLVQSGRSTFYCPACQRR